MRKLIFTVMAVGLLLQGCRCAKQSQAAASYRGDSTLTEVTYREVVRFDTVVTRGILHIDSVVTVYDTLRRRTVIHGLTAGGSAMAGTRTKASAADTLTVAAHKEFTGQSVATARCETSFPWYWIVVALAAVAAVILISRGR